MTIEQFHREFKIFMDKVDSSAYAEFKPWEIDTLLNESQDRIIKQRYGGNNIYKSSFEQTQKRTDDLKNISKTRFLKVQPVTSFDFYGYEIFQASLASLYEDKEAIAQAPEEYMFYLRSRAEIDNGCKEWKQVNLVKQDDLETIFVDPFNRPSPEYPIIYFEDNSIFIVCGNGSATGFTVTFIKRPDQMSLGTYGVDKTECELSEHLHREIVQGAVTIALENIESRRTQSQVQVNEMKVE